MHTAFPISSLPSSVCRSSCQHGEVLSSKFFGAQTGAATCATSGHVSDVFHLCNTFGTFVFFLGGMLDNLCIFSMDEFVSGEFWFGLTFSSGSWTPNPSITQNRRLAGLFAVFYVELFLFNIGSLPKSSSVDPSTARLDRRIFFSSPGVEALQDESIDPYEMKGILRNLGRASGRNELEHWLEEVEIVSSQTSQHLDSSRHGSFHVCGHFMFVSRNR